MSKNASDILALLEKMLPKQNLRVEDSGPMALISQVNWAIEIMEFNIDSGKAFDIEGEIYRHLHCTASGVKL